MKQLLSQEQVATVERLWSSGEPVTVICEAVGITRDTLIERRRPGEQLAHLGRRVRGVGPKNIGAPDPTPEEIRDRTAAIRATWSETERLNRISAPGANVDTWTGERTGGRGATFRMPRRSW
jgi:hypothetical protein